MQEEHINSEAKKNSVKPLVFKTFDGLVYFNYSNILMFKADGHRILLYTTSDNPPERYNIIKILHTLSYIEKKYCNDLLYRCHRSAIINCMYIEKLEIKTCKLFLSYGIVVQVSEDYLKYFTFIPEA